MNATETQSGSSLDPLVSLRIRSLIADKEMVTAQANLDLARGGEWRCDYAAWHGQIDAEIQELLKQANSVVSANSVEVLTPDPPRKDKPK